VLTPSLLVGVTLTIPANGILKRFQVRENTVVGSLDGIGVNSVGPGTLLQQVVFRDSAGSPRTIFSSARSIPGQYTALFDIATTQRVYAVNYSAGDNELEVNQGSAYGKHTDPFAKHVVYTPGVLWGRSGGLGPPTGILEYTFAALYLTLP
jgi:hypothetical protein